MDRIILTTDLVMDMIKLYQYKGKEFHYEAVFSDDHDAMVKQTIELETIAIAKFLQLKLTEPRVKLLAKKDLVPKNKDEAFILNFKRAITLIQSNPDHFEMIPNEVLALARVLFKNIKDVHFAKVTHVETSGLLTEHKSKSKRDELQQLLELYTRKSKSKEFELTLLITNFYVDFMNMHLMEEEHEFMAVMMLYVLLFAEGFRMFHYVSFFDLLYTMKAEFNTAFLQANYHWKEGFSQTSSLNRMIIKLLLIGYENVEQQLRDYTFDAELNKSDNIENTILKGEELFTKDDIRRHHPFVSDSTINRTLKRLKDEDKVRPLGYGRSAKWMRVVEPNPRFNKMAQMSLFGDEN